MLIKQLLIKNTECTNGDAEEIAFKHFSPHSEFKQFHVTKASGNIPIRDAKQEYVKEELRRQLGIRTFEPRAGGAGSSNTGNVAKIALAHPEILSSILSSENCVIPADFIRKINHIGIALNCSRNICPEKLHEMCQDAKKAYFEAGLSWYPLCPSVHKVLEHSREFLIELKSKSCILSIGDTSETPLKVIFSSF